MTAVLMLMASTNGTETKTLSELYKADKWEKADK